MASSGELRGKGRCGVLAGKTVWSTPERLRGEVLTTIEALYKSTFTFTSFNRVLIVSCIVWFDFRVSIWYTV